MFEQLGIAARHVGEEVELARECFVETPWWIAVPILRKHKRRVEVVLLLRGREVLRPTPSTRCCLRSCVCSFRLGRRGRRLHLLAAVAVAAHRDAAGQLHRIFLSLVFPH